MKEDGCPDRPPGAGGSAWGPGSTGVHLEGERAGEAWWSFFRVHLKGERAGEAWWSFSRVHPEGERAEAWWSLSGVLREGDSEAGQQPGPEGMLGACCGPSCSGPVQT